MAATCVQFTVHVAQPIGWANLQRFRLAFKSLCCWGIKGNRYFSERYQLPEIKISTAIVSGATVDEENNDFINDAFISPQKPLGHYLESALIQGSIGWPVFKNYDCLFDFPHSNVIIAENRAVLEKETSYIFENFDQIPFTLDISGIILSIQTELGTKKFMLDTGSPRSFLKDKQLAKENESSLQLKMGSRTWEFHFFEFADVFSCDGILGIDFFKKNILYLDFHNHIAYIKQHQNLQEKWVTWMESKTSL